MLNCCRQGFRWDGQPVGQEGQIAGQKAYITGDDKASAILFCHDAFGWKWNNNRLLADHLAQEVGATVYLPDFFHGTAVDAEALSPDPSKFDWSSWLSRNSVDKRMSEVLEVVEILRREFSKVGAIGHCWGGKAAIQLGGQGSGGPLDCVSIAHPSLITKDEIRSLKCPIQIVAPENDPAFSLELKSFCNEEIPRLGIDYDYQFFPGMSHGFATRCNMNDAKEKKALERAKNAAVHWFSNYLTL